MPFGIDALVTSQVYFTEFNLRDNIRTPGEDVSGDFTIWNYEKSVVPDLTYRIILLGKNQEDNFTIIFDDQSSKENFLISPDQRLKKTFHYKLPDILPSGNYKLRTQLFNSKGISMAWRESDIQISSGTNSTLILGEAKILNGQITFSPNGEASLSPNESFKISFNIHNISSVNIKAHPEITIYKYSPDNSPIQNTKKDSFNIPSDSLWVREYEFSAGQEPGQYLATVAIVGSGSKPVSNLLSFRWSVKGKNAEIIEIRTNKSFYEAGETAKITVDLGSPSTEKEEKGRLSVEITDETGKTVGKAITDIILKTGQFNVDVPISENVTNPKFITTVTNEEGEELDQYSTITKYETTKTGLSWETILMMIVITVALIILSISIISSLLKKSRSRPKVILLILVFGALFLLGAEKTLAFEQVSAGPPCCDGDTAISHNEPSPEFLYEVGSYVLFSGTVYLPSSPFETMAENAFNFYVGDRNGVALEDFDTGEGIIKVIDEDNSNVIKIENVSSVSPMYNFAFRIPLDSPYAGEARFYIQYRGREIEQWSPRILGDWHWIIGYQDVIIQESGEGGFYIALAASQTELRPGDKADLTVNASNKSPCLRLPVDVIEAIDVSSSMLHRKIMEAKDAAKIFVNEMDPLLDQIGITSFTTDAFLESELTSDFDKVRSAISGLNVDRYTYTCTGCGLALSNTEIINNGRLGAIRCILLLTDGVSNRCIDEELLSQVTGTTDCDCGGPSQEECITQEMIEKAQEAAMNSTVIYTVELDFGGADNQDLLEEIAEITGGSYKNVPFSPTKQGYGIEDTFKAIAGALKGWSYNTTIRINIPEEYFNLEGYDTGRCIRDGDYLVCNAGDLECGDKTIIESLDIEIEVKPDIPADTDVNIEAEIFNEAGKAKASETITISIVTNRRPDKPEPISNVIWNHCLYQTLSVPVFNWTYSDPDGDPQADYEIRIDDDLNFFDGDQFADTGGGGASTGYTPPIQLWRVWMEWGSNYWWTVRVQDAYGKWSDWSSPTHFKAPSHAAPWPDFTHEPRRPSLNEIVYFADNSTCYSVGTTPDACPNNYSWDFGDGESGTGKNNVSHSYAVNGPYNVRLAITDDVATCSKNGDSPVRIGYASGNWTEISPPFF